MYVPINYLYPPRVTATTGKVVTTKQRNSFGRSLRTLLLNFNYTGFSYGGDRKRSKRESDCTDQVVL